jgi:hypothetical protein
MAVETQVVDLKFTQGLDTRTQDKLVLPGKWTDLLNLTLSENNTLQRRDGCEPLVATGNGNGLVVAGNELLVANGPSLSSVSTAASSLNAVTGSIGNVGITKSELRRNSTQQRNGDCATGGGYTCYVWTDASGGLLVNQTGVSVMLVDSVTGAHVIPPTVMRTGSSVTPVSVAYADDAFFIFYLLDVALAPRKMYCRVIQASAPSILGAETTLISDILLPAVNFDICTWKGSGPPDEVAVVYRWLDPGAGAASVRFISVGRVAATPSIAVGPVDLVTNVEATAAGITGVAVCADSTNANVFAFVMTNAGTALGSSFLVVDGGGAITTALTTFDATVSVTTAECHICACLDGSNIRVFRDFQSEWGVAGFNGIVTTRVNAGGVVSGPFNLIGSSTYNATAKGVQGPFIHGKPFFVPVGAASRVYLPVWIGSSWQGNSLATSNARTFNQQNTFFVLDCGSSDAAMIRGVAVGRALAGSFGVSSLNNQAPQVRTPCASPQIGSTGEFFTVATEFSLLTLSGSDANISQPGLIRLDMTPNFSLPPIPARLGESTYLAGGSLAEYDGLRTVEQAFPEFPEGIFITVLGAGTGLVTDGVHQVAVVYEWIDNAGQRHQSAPSPAVQVTANSGGANTGSLVVTVPTMLMSQKVAGEVKVVAYMTQAGGISFNRVLRDNGVIGDVFNNIGAATVTVTIDDSDATIAQNELLYTQPNIAGTTLRNDPPPPCSYVASAQNRLFFDVTDQPLQYGYSQEYVNNQGLQFSSNFRNTLPAESGGFVAISEMDEKVIVFARDHIYVQYGTGPTPSGGYNNYLRPQDIQADVGCSDSRSLLPDYPGGIIFKSKKGWYVLGRDLSTKYIGEGVRDFDSLAVRSAVLLADRQEARFLLSDGTTLCYSYLVDQWSYFQPAATLSYVPVCGAWWPRADLAAGGVYAHVSLTQGLNKDTPGSYTDRVAALSVAVPTTRARTGWLRMSQLESFQRVKWLYLTTTFGDAPTSLLDVSVDYDDTTLDGLNVIAMAKVPSR